MEKGFSPLDEELALLPGSLAPRQQEHLVHLASWMPFDKAAQMIEEILSVQTTQETVRQITQRMGACMEAARAADSPEEQEAKEPPKLRYVFSADGAMVSLVHKQWVEARTLAIGEPQEKLNTEGQKEIHVGSLSYFSRLADASTFIDLADIEMKRRMVREAKEVCAVMDGADWLQDFTNKYRSDAVRVLDFAHAAEHVTQLLEALEKAGVRFPPQMLDRCLHILKHRGPGPLLRIAAWHLSQNGQPGGESTHLRYLRSREALMQYPQFQQQGWPIGSGMVESANKNVVEARLKGTGMHWKRSHVNPMLELRNAVCNDRWQEMWQKALKELKKQQALRRFTRAQSEAQSFSASDSSLPSSQETSSAGTTIFPAPVATPQSPSSSQPKRRNIPRETAPDEPPVSPQRSEEASKDICICGTPFTQPLGRSQIKRYCSRRCASLSRKRTQRERDKQGISQESQPIPEGYGGKESICDCGTHFMQPMQKGVIKRYCSRRCASRVRKRNEREREKQRMSSLIQQNK